MLTIKTLDIFTSPVLKNFCSGANPLILSDHKRALASVERINLIGVSRVNNDLGVDEEGLLSKLVKSAKKFIKRAITRNFRVPNTVGAVCGVRG